MEEEGEDDDAGEGFEECPGESEEGLSVSNADVAPGEESEQFAVVPELVQVGFPPGAISRDDGEECGHLLWVSAVSAQVGVAVVISGCGFWSVGRLGAESTCSVWALVVWSFCSWSVGGLYRERAWRTAVSA